MARELSLSMKSPNRFATYLLIFASIFGMVYILDPTTDAYGLVEVSFFKYLPYWLPFCSFIIYLQSGELRFNLVGKLLSTHIALMLAGSIYAIIDGNPLEQTYFGRAFGGIVLLAFFGLAQIKVEFDFFFKKFIPLFLLMTFLMSLNVILFKLGLFYSELVQMYQIEVVFLAAAAIMTLYYFTGWRRYFFSAYFLLSVALVGKTTSTILFIFCLTYIFINRVNANIKVSRYRSASLKGAAVILFLFFSLIVGVIINDIIYSRLGSREDEVRSISLAMRFDEFLGSPLYGNLFSGSPLIEISMLTIPSHSDVLDQLAFGGGISILCFFLPIIYLVKSFLLNSKVQPLLSWSAFVVVAGLFTMLVNPTFSVPGFAYIFWMTAGLLAGSTVISNLKS